MRASITAGATTGGLGFACATRLNSLEGFDGLQHECSIWVSPQVDNILRQHSCSAAVNAAPGIKQNIEGTSSTETTISPMMSFARFIARGLVLV